MTTLQSVMIGVVMAYVGFLTVLYVAEFVTKIRNNFSKSNENGQVTMRDQGKSNKIREIAEKMGRSVKKKVSRVFDRRKVQKTIKELLKKTGISKRKLSDVTYFKKKKK